MESEAEHKQINDGQAAVIGGLIKIKAPVDANTPGALLKQGEGVMLLVNGTVIEDSCRVFPEDKVEVNPIEYAEPIQVEVKISPDAMTAAVRFIPARRITYDIIDQPFASEILIEGRRREMVAPGGSVDDLKKALARENVRFKLSEAALQKALDEPGVWHTVAEGSTPLEGRHGDVEPLIKGELKPVTYAQDKDRVDFRERYEIEQVVIGDVLAVVHPPVPGKPGRTVTGRRIEPAPVYPAVVRCGDGAVLEVGGQIVATRKGVPSYKKGREYHFQVDNLYIHRGDIDIRSGNTTFHGHLKIEGDIFEGMKVLADGNLVVGGAAAGATILAGGNIVFKNQAINCQVRAGWKDTMLQEIYAMVEQLCASVGSALNAVAEIASTLQKKGNYNERIEAALVRTLIQSKFSEIPEIIAKLQGRAKVTESILPGELVQTVRATAPHFLDYNYSHVLGRSVLEKIYTDLLARVDEKKESIGKACITAPYVQNSNLTCTGDIIITGSGVYNSHFKCNGAVRIDKNFRGGSIEAGGEVKIGEAGVPRLAGDQGLVQVPKDGTVCLGKAYEGFCVTFSEWEYRCSTTVTNVCLRFDPHEHNVKIEPWER